jgi:hypothetical protein
VLSAAGYIWFDHEPEAPAGSVEQMRPPAWPWGTLSERARPAQEVVIMSVRSWILTGAIVASAALRAAKGEAQSLASSMTPERIEEAIRLASDEKSVRSLLAKYVVQTHAGWGDGPRIGTFSTPFVRVVQAATAALKTGKAFSPSDVTPGDLAPELHVIVTFQPSGAGDAKEVAVESVTIARRRDTSRAGDIQPLRMPALTTDYQSRYGQTFDAPGIVAIFPLTALAADHEIRVSFREVVKGSSAMSYCRECVVPFPLAGIR